MTQRCIAGGIWSKTISPKSRSSAPSPRDTTRQSKASAPTSTLPLRSSPQGKCQQTLIQRGGPLILHMLPNVQQATIKPIITQAVAPGTLIHTDEYDIYARLPAWGYGHKRVCHAHGE